MFNQNNYYQIKQTIINPASQNLNILTFHL